jgi:ferrous iron transport protein B
MADSQVLRIALVGRPNVGKTTLFNALTGSSQKVANYAGVTVERVEGMARIGGESALIIDIPGLFSLRALSEDETVAKDALVGAGRPDVLAILLDATDLERCLFLFSQVSELGLPVLAVLTMSDVAMREGAPIDHSALEAELKCPVHAVDAVKGDGLEQLLAAARMAAGLGSSPVDLRFPPAVRAAVARLAAREDSPTEDEREIREHLLFGGLEAPEAWRQAAAAEREGLLGSGIQPRTLDAQTRYGWAAHVVRETAQGIHPGRALTDKIDRVLTHRFWGSLIFLGLMYLVFASIYTLASPFMDAIESAVGWLGDAVSPLLESQPILQSLAVDGVIGGVGAAVVFLPQILILFLFISILEGTGYLARAAFLMDRALGWCGLNGRAFIPLLSSFACAVPGIMATRVMPDRRSRLATIMVAPLMSCSARLPVYVLVIGAFFEPMIGPAGAGLALFLMHFVGVAAAAPAAWLLTRGRRASRLPLALELPRYQAPKARDVALTLLNRAKVFLKTAGTMIFVMSIIIWSLSSFPRSSDPEAEYRPDYEALSPLAQERVSLEGYLAQRQMEASALGRMGRFLEPIFVPAGFDWRMTTAILAAFPAREVVVASLGILFTPDQDVEEDEGGLREGLKSAVWPDGRPLITPWTAAGFMVFFALCCQCMATLAVMRRELGSWKWPLIAFAGMTCLAWLSAVILNQIGLAVG